MAFGNNRSAAKARAVFQTSGGTILKYRHPYLTGQISKFTQADEIDVSSCVRLNDTFLNAQAAQDSSAMEALVDGSTITITNHMLAGQLTLQVVRTTGLVGEGDLVAAAQLVVASKDSVGGTFTVIEMINGKRIITVFYGVAWKNVPHLIKAGNSVVTYPLVMNYSGWVQGLGSVDALNEQTIWAVGNKYGLSAQYKPYAIQDAESANDYYSGKPLSAISGVDASDIDSADGDDQVDAVAPGANSASDGVDTSKPMSSPTWGG